MTAARTELLSLLGERAARLGDRPLISDETGSTGAGRLIERVEAKARALRAAGAGPGVLVGTLGGPAAEFVSEVFAILATGAVAVPLSRRLTPWELARLGERCPLDLLWAPLDSPSALPFPAEGCGARRLTSQREPARRSPGPGEAPRRRAFEAAATAQITSGTTGRPRVALRSADALLAEVENYRAALALGPDSRLLCPVPLQHAYGFGLCALAAPLAGAHVRCTAPDRPRLLLREIADDGVTLFVGVPPMLRLLARSARALPWEGRTVGFLSAGMALDAHTAELVATRLRGHIGQVYGTTETGPICVTRPAPWRPDATGPGAPLPGVEVRLVPVPETGPDTEAGTGRETRADTVPGTGQETGTGTRDTVAGTGQETGAGTRDTVAGTGQETGTGTRDTVAGTGQGTGAGTREETGGGTAADTGTGLVTVTSRSAMLGYAERDSVDTAPLRGGFTTGDLGRWEEGRLVLAGRLSTCINVAGAKIGPEEIEAVLLAFPEVASCLVAGADDPVLGQRIVATVTPGTVDLEKLERFCRERLSPSWVPHSFASVAHLPTTETGKVIRPRTGPPGQPGRPDSKDK
ncbi:class I adenylate-forming enzyme family protein [Streptomyces sp. NPDC005820]|uniref:class I adenylate-forming enzyme family protein n=1 Tax=Streptomyces sp. NPDC005820 TaxID=3157069 RepID=UPI0033E92B44